MRITIDRNGGSVHITVEQEPIPPERCKLASAAIGGAVLLGLTHMVGFWAIPWMVGAHGN